MSKELVISAGRHETRVAVLEDDQLVEIYFQRENEYSLAGSIHKGRVTRVLPGMQSAFVDIGLERDAFLYVSDFFEDNDEYDKIVSSVEDKVLKLDRPVGPPPVASGAPVPEAVSAPVPVEAAPEREPEVTAAPAPPPAGAPSYDRRDDRGGRRGRRRGRGGRGNGRGLPDSKFYSPGQRPPEAESRPDSRYEPRYESHREAPPAVGEASEAAEDVIILPGESLAKYRKGAEPVTPQEQSPFDEGPIVEDLEPVATAPEPPAEGIELPRGEALDAAAEAPAETVAEVLDEPLAEISVETIQVIVEAAEAAPLESLAPSVEIPVGEEAAEFLEEPSITAEEQAEIEESVEGALAEEEAEEGAAATELEAVVDVEEGPEPARIPTSLTAQLREQGPRFGHRVSRRSRRRGGRDGREPRDGRGPQQEGGPRPPEQRGEEKQVAAAKPEGRERPAAPSISDLLKERQEIIVQIAKEPLGQKGARITSHIALPGRFLVYMPTVDHIGVSRKIPSDEERQRLKRVLQTHRTGIPGGYIVRTAGEGHTEEELRADMMFLYNLWLDMRQKAERKPAPCLIHHDLNVVERVLRDQLTSSFKSIWVDSEELYESILRFVERFQPALVSRVRLYTRKNPIFDEYGITAELEKALRPKVWLKSGGYIVINQTEALVAIDINTGKFVGKSNRLEDTIVKTNTDAIKEIVRQIRLRDLGGIIVVDFIDMDERKNRQKVMQALEESMRADRAPYKILQFNDFGLVAITRKRVKQSLERTLCTPCPYCEGGGYVKSAQTVVGEILQEAHKLAGVVEGKDVMLRVAPDVARLLKSNQNSFLQELEEVLGRTVIVKSDHQLHQEKFDLA